MRKGFFTPMVFLALMLTGCRADTVSTAVSSPTAALPPAGTRANPATDTLLPTLEPTATTEPELTVIVTTADDVADGGSASLEELASDPGPDGAISLREAVLAANGTAGKARIIFDASLAGKTIVLEGGQQHADPRLILAGEGIAIDGDINRDGEPDITLDGSRMNKNMSSAFLLSGRDLTIDHLILRGFQQYAVILACIDPKCSTKPFNNIRVRGNRITSGNGGGIVVSPLNINGPLADPSYFSDMEITGLEITGNVIEITGGLNFGVFMHAAGGGVSRNRLADVVIQGNRIRSPGAAITVNAADANSAYFGYPGEIKFSDDSIVENIVLKDNFLDPQGVGGDGARPTGIILLAGNMGNSGNTIRRVEITGNEVSANAEYGIAIYATMIDSSSYLPDPGAASRENLVKDVLVEGNTIRAWMNSITLVAASGEYYVPSPNEPKEPGETGRLSNIRILSNQLLDFQFDGINLFGGVGASDNRVDGVRIGENTIASKDITKGVAIYVFGGGCSRCKRISERNQITALVIQGNTAACNSFLWLSGGMEELASDNLVEFYLGPNEITPADAEVVISDSAAKEPQGNRAVRLDTAPK